MITPTVGRIVHYQSYGTPGGEFLPEARAAIIAGNIAEDGTADIVVFNPSGLFFNRCPHSAQPKPGCWNWPPRSDDSVNITVTNQTGGITAGKIINH